MDGKRHVVVFRHNYVFWVCMKDNISSNNLFLKQLYTKQHFDSDITLFKKNSHLKSGYIVKVLKFENIVFLKLKLRFLAQQKTRNGVLRPPPGSWLAPWAFKLTPGLVRTLWRREMASTKVPVLKPTWTRKRSSHF